MGLMTYSGGWRRRPFVLGSLPADQVDPTHLNPPTGGGADPQITGARTGAPDFLVGDASGWALRSSGYVVNAPVDRTPDRHDQGVADPGQAPAARADAEANAARSLDQGAARRQRTGPVVLRGWSERYTTERRQLPPISDGSLAQVRLQQLGRPENMVDSTIGHETFRWVDRKVPYRWRRPDMRPVSTGTAASVSDSPPLANGGNAYTSPFALLRSGRVRQMMTPMIRRVPRPYDETVIVDGTDGAASPYEYQSWGL